MSKYGIGLLLLLCLGSLQAQVVFQPAQHLDPKTRNYDQQHLRLEVSFDFDQGQVDGHCDLTLIPLQDHFRTLVLHCADTMVSRVTVDQRPVHAFGVQSELLTILLDRPYAKGQKLTVGIDYQARPTRGLYFFHPTHAHPEIPYQIWSQGEGTDNHHWFPCYDQPDDRLTSEMIIHVAPQYTAISNGRLLAVRQEQGGQVYHYRMDQSHVTYLISVVVGSFDQQKEKHGKIDLIYAVPRGWGAYIPLAFAQTPGILDFYSDYLAYPYPYGIYRQTVVWDFIYAGMENITATTLHLPILHDQRAHPDYHYQADDLVAHELAHSWFGNLVTCRSWPHLFLNEGFATYLNDLWVEHQYGQAEFLWHRRHNNERYFRSTSLKARNRLRRRSKTREPLEGHPYQRGSAILHMLRGVLGDQAFQQALRDYLQAYHDRCVVTEDLRRILEKSSGKSLDWFFNQWVYGAGFPHYRVQWQWSQQKKAVLLTVKQVQELTKNCDLFRMPVRLAFTWIKPQRHTIRRVITVAAQEETFCLPLPSRPAIVRFDEGNWILKKVDFTKSLAQWRCQLLHDPDVSGRMDAAVALGTKGAAAVAALAQALEQEKFYGVRQLIVKSLGKIKSAQARQALCHAATDPCPRVRREAISALAHFPAKKVGTLLLKALKEDPSYYVQAAAARSLARVRPPQVKEYLLRVIDRPSYREVLQQAVLTALADLGDKTLLPQIIARIHYRPNGDQHGKINAMVKLGGRDPRVLKKLRELLQDPYFRTRQRAAYHLGKLGDLEAIPLLLKLLEKEHYPRVKKSFRQAIRKIALTAAKHLLPEWDKSPEGLKQMIRDLERQVRQRQYQSELDKLQIKWLKLRLKLRRLLK